MKLATRLMAPTTRVVTAACQSIPGNPMGCHYVEKVMPTSQEAPLKKHHCRPKAFPSEQTMIQGARTRRLHSSLHSCCNLDQQRRLIARPHSRQGCNLP